MSITGRECIRAAVNHQEPGRLPVDFGGRHTTIHTRAHQNLKHYLGLEGGEEKFRQFWLQTVEVDPRVNQILGGDVAAFCTRTPVSWSLEIDNQGIFFDEWGASYRMPENSYYYDYHTHPLAAAKTVQDLDQYHWPDPLDPSRYEGLREAVSRVHQRNQQAIMMTIAPAGSWEHTWTLRGPEQAMMDLILNRDLYEEILDRTVQFQILQWTEALKLVGEMVDVVSMSDDFGTQVGPMVSLELYRSIFKPRLIKVIENIKKYTNAKIYMHTDGSVYDFLPDMIEAGVEIINPVQKECRNMEPEKLKKEFGDQLVFWGASVVTKNLEFGSPEEIRREARETIEILAPGGGFVYGPIHNIQPLVPAENIVALLEAARDFDIYTTQD